MDSKEDANLQWGRLDMRERLENTGEGQPTLSARRAWGALALSVVVYEIACPKGETLSEGIDRLMETRKGKALAIGAVGLTASHLINAIPEKFDPFHYALLWKDRPESLLE